MKSAKFIFNFDSKEEAKIIAESLHPEIKHKIPKTDVEISISGKKFSLKIKAKDVSYLEKGKKITFILDTALCENCFKAAKQASLLISEAPYSEKEKELPLKYKHLTSKQAAQIAKKSQVKKLILTHISQRYQNKEKEILKEARKIFKNTEIAEDFDKLEI